MILIAAEISRSASPIWPALRLDGAEQMQRVEIVRRGLEHAGIEFFRLAQPVLPVQRDRLLHGLRDVESGWLHGRRNCARAVRPVNARRDASQSAPAALR